MYFLLFLFKLCFHLEQYSTSDKPFCGGRHCSPKIIKKEGESNMFQPSSVKPCSTSPLAVEHVFAASWMSAHASQACAYYSAASSRWINTCWKYYKQDICMWPKSLTSAPPCKQVSTKALFNDPGLKHLRGTKCFPILRMRICISVTVEFLECCMHIYMWCHFLKLKLSATFCHI